MQHLVVAWLLAWGIAQPALADYKNDIGYTRRAQELGSALPDGSGVTVMQVEASTGTDGGGLPIWNPVTGTTDSAYAGVTFSFFTTSSGHSSTTSGHAAGVGSLLYGNNAMANGIGNVRLSYAGDWLLNDFLRVGTGYEPATTSARIINHSWVGSFQSSSSSLARADAEALRRTDWLVQRDSAINVAAMNNGGNQPLLGSSYNSIAVGLTSGGHAQGSYDLGATDSLYDAGRTRPDVVAPAGNNSSAASMVSSLSALLVETGHAGADTLSNGSTTNRAGNTIYNAERAETIKAALMAGADRETHNGSGAQISDYRNGSHATANGLDSRYGAGQVNAYESHRIIAAGEQEAGSVLCRASVQSCSGFDHVENFGGGNDSPKVLSYSFTADGAHDQLAASLAWNVEVDSYAPNGAAALYNLGLYLYDETAGRQLVGSSTSLADNTQNLWYELVSGHTYTLSVVSLESDSFDWSYALAWNFTDASPVPLPLPPALLMLLSGLLGLAPALRRRTSSQ